MPMSELLNEFEAAEYLDVKVSTLRIWRYAGRYDLPFVKIGRLVRYRAEDLEKWIASRVKGAEVGR